MSYNGGWSNRATWNVSLWLSNDESLYREINRLERRHVDRDDDDEVVGDLDDFAEAIETFCKDVWPEGVTPDNDRLDEADFNEIAGGWVL